MEITSVASQVLAMKQVMMQSELGIAAMKQAIKAQKQMADMLAKNSAGLPSAPNAPQEEGFSTYA